MDQETTSTEQDNRREWLRIDDRLLLEYWVEGSRPATRSKQSLQATEEDITNFVTKPTSDLLANTPCEEAEPVLVPWLMKIDWVLELLLKSLVTLTPDGLAIPRLTNVNISAGGLSFQGSEAPPEGARVELKLILPPFTPIHAHGKVIRVERGPSSESLHTIAVKFTVIRQDDQERLIRYILTAQAKQLRNRLTDFEPV